MREREREREENGSCARINWGRGCRAFRAYWLNNLRGRATFVCRKSYENVIARRYCYPEPTKLRKKTVDSYGEHDCIRSIV